MMQQQPIKSITVGCSWTAWLNFITGTKRDNVGAWHQVEQPIIKVKSTPQTRDWHCKYSKCVGGQNCLQMNNKLRHNPGESHKQHEAGAAGNMHCTVTAHRSVTGCTVWRHSCLLNVSRTDRNQETKLINRELYWWDPLVGNGITQAFNWTGLTFAEQGVVAFVSAQRRNVPPHTCITLRWLRRRRSLPPKRKLTVTLGRVKHVCSHISVNGRLVEMEQGLG